MPTRDEMLPSVEYYVKTYPKASDDEILKQAQFLAELRGGTPQEWLDLFLELKWARHKAGSKQTKGFYWAIAMGAIAVIILGILLVQNYNRANTWEEQAHNLQTKLTQAEAQIAGMKNPKYFSSLTELETWLKRDNTNTHKYKKVI
ncbi:MAG TPA: hypothetical protein VJ441_02910 [Dehalococcoidia bacterium]|nr:hypothetical protein [Dehalococcoidia bacterium]